MLNKMELNDLQENVYITKKHVKWCFLYKNFAVLRIYSNIRIKLKPISAVFSKFTLWKVSFSTKHIWGCPASTVHTEGMYEVILCLDMPKRDLISYSPYPEGMY